MTLENSVPNPFIGPRTFTDQESDRFFGRESEARALYSLVVSQPLVLFSAPSGAGKSSLINTRLLPMLQESDFLVLPTGRVSGRLPPDVEAVANIYTYNLLLSLDQDRNESAGLTNTSLKDYLQQTRPKPSTDPDAPTLARLLIIDQFEEILTTNVEHWRQRDGFFRQLAQAIKTDSLLWVLLVIREDHLGALEPFARLLPGRLRTRFSMPKLDLKTATSVIEQTAAAGGRPFAPGIAEQLVEDLAQIRAHGHTKETVIGESVEALQLQVVCFRLWENLQDRPPGPITAPDLAELGDNNQALAHFYDDIIARTVEQTEVSELDLRDWFEQHLITEGHTRGLVFRGQSQTGGLANQVIDFLTGHFLLHAIVRAGAIWYELVHDRLIDPILQANEAWRLNHPLIQIARTWAEADRNPSMLLSSQQLQAVPVASWTGLGPLVKEYLAASQAAEAQPLVGHASNHQPRIAGDLTLISPISPKEQVALGPTSFVWSWQGPLSDDEGFELRVWAAGEHPTRAHSTIADNQSGRIQQSDQGIYSLTVDLRNIADATQAGVDLWWTVALVRIKPTYVDLDLQAEPITLPRLMNESATD